MEKRKRRNNGHNGHSYDNLKIRTEISQRFKNIATQSGMEYSSFLDRLMDDSPLSNYFASIIELNEKRKEEAKPYP